MTKKIGIIGSGSWGTALAQVLADNHQHVVIWGRNVDEIVDIAHYHRNDAYFPGIPLNDTIAATTQFDELNDADYYILAVPTAAIESVTQKLNQLINHRAVIINVAKGFHPTTHQLLSEVIKETIDADKLKAVVSLIGPSHAEEVVRRLLTSVNAISDHEEEAIQVQNLFSNGYFRVYRNNDVVGAQIGVAIKNIISVASGILTGRNLGDNAKAALITRGLAEMTRYGVHFGGRPDTFLGLCGVGDLVVTCTSIHSRNYQAGIIIGQRNSAVDFMRENTKTVEGIHATKVVYAVSQAQGISMPITEQMHAVLYEGKRPDVAIDELMNRELKSEY